MSLSKSLIFYKYVVVIPGHVITWYSSELPDFSTELSFPESASGYIAEVEMLRDCSVEELTAFMNGSVNESFKMRVLAEISDKYWTPVRPTVQAIVQAVLTELKND
jgi:hypothetical protein